jgi:hypothetical protein
MVPRRPAGLGAGLAFQSVWRPPEQTAPRLSRRASSLIKSANGGQYGPQSPGPRRQQSGPRLSLPNSSRSRANSSRCRSGWLNRWPQGRGRGGGNTRREGDESHRCRGSKISRQRGVTSIRHLDAIVKRRKRHGCSSANTRMLNASRKTEPKRHRVNHRKMCLAGRVKKP